MATREILRQLFRRRPEAPWVGYVPATIVAGLFTLMGLHDGLPLLMIAALLLCVVQLYCRTLAGWLILLGVYVLYGIEVAIRTPILGEYGEYVFFMACGFLPALALIAWRPRLTRWR